MSRITQLAIRYLYSRDSESDGDEDDEEDDGFN